MVDTVAALYVDPTGPYPKIVRDCWDESRDAKKYNGSFPVVAHPPCGPWGRLKFLNKHQDPECGPEAVRAVRRFGGVLEHPQHSTLFKHCNLPRPGEPRDCWGGETYEIRQVAWGHRCEKITWLYIVGVEPRRVICGIRRGGIATHRITNGSRGKTWLPRVGAREARLTPVELALWLVSLALHAKPVVNP